MELCSHRVRGRLSWGVGVQHDVLHTQRNVYRELAVLFTYAIGPVVDVYA